VEGMSGVSAASMIDELINIPLAAIYTMLFSAIFFAAVFSLAFYYAVLRRFIPEIED
jgi:cytochrome d ubiquinol oxidase subunit I